MVGATTGTLDWSAVVAGSRVAAGLDPFDSAKVTFTIRELPTFLNSLIAALARREGGVNPFRAENEWIDGHHRKQILYNDPVTLRSCNIPDAQRRSAHALDSHRGPYVRTMCYCQHDTEEQDSRKLGLVGVTEGTASPAKPAAQTLDTAKRAEFAATLLLYLPPPT